MREYMEEVPIFTNDKGEPYRLFIHNCPEKEKIEEMIELGFGTVESCPGGENTIVLAAPGFNTGKDEVFSIHYITACCSKRKKLNIKEFRLNEISKYNRDFNPMDVLEGILTWSQAKKYRKDSLIKLRSLLSTGGHVNDDAATEASLHLRRQRKYTRNEQEEIVKSVMNHKAYDLVRGNDFWKMLEQNMVCKKRKWQSMKEQFLEKVLPDIESYDLSETQIIMFKNVKIKNTCRKYKRSQERNLIQEATDELNLIRDDSVRLYKKKDTKRNVTKEYAVQLNRNAKNVGVHNDVETEPVEHAECYRRNRNYYAEDEDRAILNFIVESERYHETGGVHLWKLMERKQAVPGRSWQSMKERYRKVLINKLDHYLPKETVQHMKKSDVIGSAHKVKKRRQRPSFKMCIPQSTPPRTPNKKNNHHPTLKCTCCFTSSGSTTISAIGSPLATSTPKGKVLPQLQLHGPKRKLFSQKSSVVEITPLSEDEIRMRCSESHFKAKTRPLQVKHNNVNDDRINTHISAGTMKTSEQQQGSKNSELAEHSEANTILMTDSASCSTRLSGLEMGNSEHSVHDILDIPDDDILGKSTMEKTSQVISSVENDKNLLKCKLNDKNIQELEICLVRCDISEPVNCRSLGVVSSNNALNVNVVPNEEIESKVINTACPFASSKGMICENEVTKETNKTVKGKSGQLFQKGEVGDNDIILNTNCLELEENNNCKDIELHSQQITAEVLDSDYQDGSMSNVRHDNEDLSSERRKEEVTNNTLLGDLSQKVIETELVSQKTAADVLHTEYQDECISYLRHNEDVSDKGEEYELSNGMLSDDTMKKIMHFDLTSELVPEDNIRDMLCTGYQDESTSHKEREKEKCEKNITNGTFSVDMTEKEVEKEKSLHNDGRMSYDRRGVGEICNEFSEFLLDDKSKEGKFSNSMHCCEDISERGKEMKQISSHTKHCGGSKNKELLCPAADILNKESEADETTKKKGNKMQYRDDQEGTSDREKKIQEKMDKKMPDKVRKMQERSDIRRVQEQSYDVRKVMNGMSHNTSDTDVYNKHCEENTLTIEKNSEVLDKKHQNKETYVCDYDNEVATKEVTEKQTVTVSSVCLHNDKSTKELKSFISKCNDIPNFSAEQNIKKLSQDVLGKEGTSVSKTLSQWPESRKFQLELSEHNYKMKTVLDKVQNATQTSNKYHVNEQQDGDNNHVLSSRLMNMNCQKKLMSRKMNFSENLFNKNCILNNDKELIEKSTSLFRNCKNESVFSKITSHNDPTVVINRHMKKDCITSKNISHYSDVLDTDTNTDMCECDDLNKKMNYCLEANFTNESIGNDILQNNIDSCNHNKLTDNDNVENRQHILNLNGITESKPCNRKSSSLSNEDVNSAEECIRKNADLDLTKPHVEEDTGELQVNGSNSNEMEINDDSLIKFGNNKGELENLYDLNYKHCIQDVLKNNTFVEENQFEILDLSDIGISLRVNDDQPVPGSEHSDFAQKETCINNSNTNITSHVMFHKQVNNIEVPVEKRILSTVQNNQNEHIDTHIKCTDRGTIHSLHSESSKFSSCQERGTLYNMNETGQCKKAEYNNKVSLTTSTTNETGKSLGSLQIEEERENCDHYYLQRPEIDSERLNLSLEKGIRGENEQCSNNVRSEVTKLKIDSITSKQLQYKSLDLSTLFSRDTLSKGRMKNKKSLMSDRNKLVKQMKKNCAEGYSQSGQSNASEKCTRNNLSKICEQNDDISSKKIATLLGEQNKLHDLSLRRRTARKTYSTPSEQVAQDDSVSETTLCYTSPNSSTSSGLGKFQQEFPENEFSAEKCQPSIQQSSFCSSSQQSALPSTSQSENTELNKKIDATVQLLIAAKKNKGVRKLERLSSLQHKGKSKIASSRRHSDCNIEFSKDNSEILTQHSLDIEHGSSKHKGKNKNALSRRHSECSISSSKDSSKSLTQYSLNLEEYSSETDYLNKVSGNSPPTTSSTTDDSDTLNHSSKSNEGKKNKKLKRDKQCLICARRQNMEPQMDVVNCDTELQCNCYTDNSEDTSCVIRTDSEPVHDHVHSKCSCVVHDTANGSPCKKKLRTIHNRNIIPDRHKGKDQCLIM